MAITLRLARSVGCLRFAAGAVATRIGYRFVILRFHMGFVHFFHCIVAFPGNQRLSLACDPLMGCTGPGVRAFSSSPRLR